MKTKSSFFTAFDRRVLGFAFGLIIGVPMLIFVLIPNSVRKHEKEHAIPAFDTALDSKVFNTITKEDTVFHEVLYSGTDKGFYHKIRYKPFELFVSHIPCVPYKTTENIRIIMTTYEGEGKIIEADRHGVSDTTMKILKNIVLKKERELNPNN